MMGCMEGHQLLCKGLNSPDGVQNGVLSRGGWSIEVESIVGTTTCRTRRTDGQDESGSRRLDEGVDAI